MLDRGTNKCCNKDITKYKYEIKCSSTSENKRMHKYNVR